MHALFSYLFSKWVFTLGLLAELRLDDLVVSFSDESFVCIANDKLIEM